ncbi:MAG: hypothetical protein QM733_10945 [Ilumatobacteraceae bacterium]
MSRRVLAVIVALLAALTLSSCGTNPVSQRDVVARVGDAELTRDELDEMLNNRIIQETLQTGAVDGTAATMSQADNVISLWISLEALQAGGAASLDDDPTVDSVLSSLPGDYKTQFDSAGGGTQTLISRFIALQNVLDNTQDRSKLVAAIQAADVHVDSRYGYWDAERVALIPFGTKLTPLATTTTSAA